MFTDEKFLKYNLSTKEKAMGKLDVNMDLIRGNKHYFPFLRDKKIVEITKFGTRNEQVIERYIINCLNDYYQKLVSTLDLVERQKMQDKYTHLYGMWRELYNYKNARDIVNINNMYEIFRYELYTMGYNESI